uniref:Secreted protein n=1 Tax=Haemonchus placei TaxID=6290 RepID=A0A0N4WQ08_HAEPC
LFSAWLFRWYSMVALDRNCEALMPNVTLLNPNILRLSTVTGLLKSFSHEHLIKFLSSLCKCICKKAFSTSEGRTCCPTRNRRSIPNSFGSIVGP